jgi:diadenosine tetraphosphate (Ap4A) HIT family hydrolase
MSVKQADHCPFCTIPPNRILESREHALLLLDAFPVSPGHSLVVSRRHIAQIFDLTATEIGDILELIRIARERIDSTLQPTGYNIGVNVGRDAGQTVMHVHIHVIPRYRGDSDDPTGGVRGVISGKAFYSERNRPD